MIPLAIAAEATVINNPQGKIVSVTERGIGFKVETTTTTTQTPTVVFGLFSSTVVLEPTSTDTNGIVHSPNFANTFDFSQSGALSLGVDENLASGNYQTLSPDATNSVVATQPILPK